MPQARMMPSSRIFESAGKAPLRDISYCSSQPFGNKGEIGRDVVDEGDIEAVDAEALQAERLQPAVALSPASSARLQFA